MKRYSPNVDSSECFQGMIEDPDGDYVEISEIYSDKLIAAAPEMLDFIREVESMMKEHPEFVKGNSKVHFLAHKAAGIIAHTTP